MSFLSFSYLAFLPTVLALYYLLPQRVKNPLLLAASYFFYACWSPVYAGPMLLTTAVTYATGRSMERATGGKRKSALALGVAVCLVILFVFKYLDFANDALDSFMHLFGRHFPHPHPDFLLPVGISFYTFQALGYLLDVYRGSVPAERNCVTYALYVSFFPQLLSGPIERSGRMLPQLSAPRRFTPENIAAGALPICFGFFKKLVIADQLAPLVSAAFGAPAQASGLQLLYAALAYSLQIYCDFSAYSDIARGSARMLGVRIMENFDRPYLATSTRDFWKRWHISLTSWFRDYLYIPLGGNRVPALRRYGNVLLVFVVSGLWHGAAATFLLWGLLHGLYQVIGIASKPLRDRALSRLGVRDGAVWLAWCRRARTFLLVSFAWIFFRADTIGDAFTIISRICAFAPGRGTPLDELLALGITKMRLLVTALSVAALFIADWLGSGETLEAKIAPRLPLRYATLFLLIAATLLFGVYGTGVAPSAFVYFQF